MCIHYTKIRQDKKRKREKRTLNALLSKAQGNVDYFILELNIIFSCTARVRTQGLIYTWQPLYH
jgi:hypothetical protein